MQSAWGILRVLGIFLLLVLSWGLFMISSAILETNSNSNLDLIPDEATRAVRLDGRELAESTLFSIFLDTKDEDVIRQLTDLAKKKMQKDGKTNNFGIDYLSDIVLFTMPYKGAEVDGVIFNLSNPQLFMSNMPSFLGNEGIAAANGQNGLILRFAGKSTKKFLNAELRTLAESIMKPGKDSKVASYIDHAGHGKFIEFYSKKDLFGKPSFFERSSFLFELNDQDLHIHGNMFLQEGKEKELSSKMFTLKPDGFHLSTRVVPEILNDTISDLLSNFGISIDGIRSLSMNYFGAKIINHSSGFFIVPQVDIILATKGSMNINDLLSNSEIIKNLDYSIEGNRIIIQKEVLYFKQLAPDCFYFGIHEQPALGTERSSVLLEISGDLLPLTNIRGGGLMTAFLEMIPSYRAGKTLAASTESVQLTLQREKDREVSLNGELTFKTDHSPMNELLRFVMVSELTE